ncbi:MAG TPA: glycosyltransferase family 4 protein [Bryobacteraceae bacterium]|nr:glycosyltransferase family 4 protein [Bryobacteraceae bacterium]
MRIAQVAPLYESVPPAKYGGTERIVSYLTEELVRQGHQVTLFASGDSHTRARLISPCERSVRLDAESRDPLASHMAMIEQVAQLQAEFDIIHFHTNYLHFSVSKRIATPSLTTLHGRLDLRELPMLFRVFADVPLVSISMAQRAPLPWLNWIGMVHHGLPPDLYRYEDAPQDYLAFVGRISPEKRVDRAIEIAKRVGMTLRIAAKVDPADRAYYESEIKPLLDHPLIEYMQEVGDGEKQELLGKARALLFPIDWPEPFGIVMLEALACGTPVIAFPCGSVPEVIDPGITGVIVQSIGQAVEAVKHIGTLRRQKCRDTFDKRFTVARMVRDYMTLYRKLEPCDTDVVKDEVRQCK